jgi:hypothetical protein
MTEAPGNRTLSATGPQADTPIVYQSSSKAAKGRSELIVIHARQVPSRMDGPPIARDAATMDRRTSNISLAQ